MRFNSQVLAIEEMFNLKDLNMDQHLGTLKNYEMRVGRENYEPKEATFKVSKEAKEHKGHQDALIVNLIRNWLNQLGS